MTRAYGIREYLVETPEQVMALHGLKAVPENRSMVMLATVWKAERARRENERRPCESPIFRLSVKFNTGTRRCEVIKWGQVIDMVGCLPYNDALRYCREHGMKLRKPEETP